MAPSPVLINIARLQARRHTSENAQRVRILLELGSLKSSDLAADQMTQMKRDLSGEPALRKVWERAIAEEILLLSAEGAAIDPGVVNLFGAVQIFEGGPVLHDCLGKKAAVAVFPLRGETSPGIGHVWAFEGVGFRCGQSSLEYDDFPADVGLGFAASHPFTGRSWRLAALLALRVLQDSQDGALLCGELARGWVITGDVCKNRISRVKLGNKLELSLPETRRWLLPGDNFADIPPVAQGLEIKASFDLDSAWAIISGGGTRRGAVEMLGWPDDVGELHVLIGGDIKAALASLLFTPKEVPVWLWHSNSETFSWVPAQSLREIMSNLRGQTNIRLIEISSSDLINAERTLRDHFREPASGTGSIVFNVTSGNRLMSYAVQSLAMTQPSMKLIYRDADAGAFEYTLLDYGERPVAASKVLGPQEVRDLWSKDSWEWLFSRSPPRVTTRDEIVQLHIDHLQPVASNGTSPNGYL